jgi:hypothetical protein
MSESFWRNGCIKFGLFLGLFLGLTGLSVGAQAAEEIAAASAKRIGHATINRVLVNGRENPVAIRPKSSITVQLKFRSDSSAWCPKCSNQIIVGYARRKGRHLERLPGGKCVYSSSGKQRAQKLTFRMNAPEQPGRYEMVVSAPQAYNCTKALRWRARTQSVVRLQIKN